MRPTSTCMQQRTGGANSGQLWGERSRAHLEALSFSPGWELHASHLHLHAAGGGWDKFFWFDIWDGSDMQTLALCYVAVTSLSEPLLRRCYVVVYQKRKSARL